MESKEKIVEFWNYCGKCKHNGEPESSDTCNECLEHSVNWDSHKPVNWEAME